MARIRSVHPGQESDEDFVALSMTARVFCLLLRCHADDNGVFEWKPKTLKMKIFPADNVEVVDLLDELQDNNQVKRFEVDGKAYGLIRNFRKYQRPKKPTAIHPLPNEFRTYVGLEDESSPPVPNQDGTDTENPPQMKDEGGRMEDEGGKYIYAGKVVKLKAKDYDAWKRAYHSIRDLNAELQRIDTGFVAKKPDNWFVAASNMLNAKHQKNLEQNPRAAPKAKAPVVGTPEWEEMNRRMGIT